jgi:hypothetical protein
VKNRINFRQGLHRVFLFVSILWIIGVFAHPLYTAHQSNQIYTEAFHECMKNHDDDFDIKWCENKFKIEMEYVPKFLAPNYQGVGLASNIATALFAPLIMYGVIRLVITVATWLRRGFLTT